MASDWLRHNFADLNEIPSIRTNIFEFLKKLFL